MEPMNITAHVNAAGDGAEIWGGTQTPSITVNVAAAVLKTKPDKIKFHQYYLGGGYGRRAMVDLVPYALQLSKETKKPVKLIWTREQDVKAAKMRPMTAHHLEAGQPHLGVGLGVGGELAAGGLGQHLVPEPALVVFPQLEVAPGPDHLELPLLHVGRGSAGQRRRADQPHGKRCEQRACLACLPHDPLRL